MRTVPVIASVLAASALAILPVKAAGLVNGNFNTGDLSGWWTYLPDTVNSSITVLNDSYSLDSSPYAYQSAKNASGNPQLGQNLGLAGGSQFEVSLAYRAGHWGGAGVGIHYYDAAWAALPEYQWVTLYDNPGVATSWTAFNSGLWTAPAAAAYVEVRLEAWGWSDTYYDNVAVNVVPEPGCSALLGLAAVLGLRRWKATARQ